MKLLWLLSRFGRHEAELVGAMRGGSAMRRHKVTGMELCPRRLSADAMNWRLRTWRI